MDANTARQRSRTYADLARAFSEAEPGLEREFTRLFLGPGRPVAHPYESVYREGRTMGDTTLDVRRRLNEEGLAPGDQTLPDHVGIELAFMAHLTAREAQAWDGGDGDGASAFLVQQDSFLYDHLTAWLPQFCHRVLAGRPPDHYAELARHTESFVIGDAARVRAWLGNGAEASALVDARWERWTVTVSQGCTLCGICVQVCRPGALRLIRDIEDGMAVLRFDVAPCDGCAACQRWCPEEIVHVTRLSDGERPPTDELARSAMLACPRCGLFHTPEAMIAKVQDRVNHGNEALRQRLTLCHDCRVMDIPLRKRNTVQHASPSSWGEASIPQEE